MADNTTLHAPSGATSDAGANPNAIKFPISPAAMRNVPIHHVGLCRNAKPEPCEGPMGPSSRSPMDVDEGVDVTDDDAVRFALLLLRLFLLMLLRE